MQAKRKEFTTFALLLSLAAAAGRQADNQPSDCVQYPISDVPRRTVMKKFNKQVRLGMEALYPREEWEAELLLSSPHSDTSCTIFFKLQGENKELSGVDHIVSRCNSWPDAQNFVVNNTGFVSIYGWSFVDLFVTASTDILLVSTKKQDVEVVKIPDTKFSGNVEAQWIPKRGLMHVNFDCYSECHLRSGIEYHSTLGDHFYLWRSTAAESLQFQAFPNSYGYVFSLETEGAPQVFGAWIEVRFEVENKSIIWNELQSNKTHIVPWTAGHIHSYFDIQNHLTIHVPGSCLVTKCYPYQLPCPDDPFQCQSVELWTNNKYVSQLLSDWQMTFEWIILGIMLLIICFLIFLVCCLRRKLRMYKMGDATAMELSKRTPLGAPKTKISKFVRKSEIYDEFSSGGFEPPSEQHPIQNSYTNEPSQNTPVRQSRMYANLAKVYKR